MTTRSVLADSSAIANAVIAKLAADQLLLDLMPDGVYFDRAPQDVSRFVIVSLVESHDVATFDGRAIEDGLFLIKAVGLSAKHPNMAGAALRLDQVLEDQPLIVDGYGWMTTYRESAIRHSAPDDTDLALMWHQRGGYYRVQMTPTGPSPNGVNAGESRSQS